jgi:hypothetical protein
MFAEAIGANSASRSQSSMKSTLANGVQPHFAVMLTRARAFYR